MTKAYYSNQGTADFYVYNAANGFVIIAADDAVKPILAYSRDRQFSTAHLPSSLEYLLKGYQSQIEAVKTANKTATTAIAGQWQALTNSTAVKEAERTTSVVVGPLLGNITWDQAPYYNDSCPNDPSGGGLSVTGCVATATAQVMKFWSWPVTGTGSHSYITATRHFSCSTNFAHTYSWSAMPVAIAGNNPNITRLMYDVGVAVDMDYTASESGAYVISSSTGTAPYCAQYALTEFFRYNPTTISGLSRSSYSDSVWLPKMRNELLARRPIIYSGFGSVGGHCWVIDGFDDTLGTNYFHCNWGWSGTGPDGYYSVDDMNPPALGTGGGGGGFIDGQAAIFGIKPYLPAIAGTLTLCVGDSANLTNATTGGTWSIDSPSVASVSAKGMWHALSPGTDTVTYAGGSVKVTSVVTVKAAPTVGPISGNNSVCMGRASDTLAVAGTGGTWSATNTNASVAAGVVNGLHEGADTIIYKVSNTCGSASDSFVVEIPSSWSCDSAAGIANTPNTGAIKIYPNPNTGTFVVALPGRVQAVTLEMVDMFGKMVLHSNYSNVSGEIPVTLSTQAPGNYIIRVIAGQQTYTKLVTVSGK